jgi:hypothetical protein
MKKILQFFISKIKYIILIYASVQLVLILNSEIEYTSDASYYFNLAQECIEQNEFYPARQHLNEDYIFAPLYINAILILLKIYNTPLIISLFNFLIIQLQILLLYKITLKIFSVNIAKITVLLYIFYLNTLGLLLLNYTELFFLLLISLSIYLFLLGKNYSLVLSGIILGGAIAVRPTGWLLLFAFLILQIYVSYKNRKISISYFYLYSGVFVFILCFGMWTYSHFGKFEYSSTTGPVNLLIGANDNATGGFKATVFEENKAGYIENPETLTYIQKGEFYKEKAITWIKENPIRWLSLTPLKLLHAFAWDDISISSLLGFQELNFGRALRNLFTGSSTTSELEKASFTTYIFYFFILFLHHLYYYLLLAAAFLGIIHLVKNKFSNDGVKLILFFSLFTILTITIIFGTPRFKYPMFILLLPIAANYINTKIIERKLLKGAK